MSISFDQTTGDTTTVAAPVPADLPGRAVDIIHAAARAAGVRLFGIHLVFAADPADGIRHVAPELADHAVDSAQRLIGALGAVAELGEPYGPVGKRQANVDATIPALGGLRVEMIVTEGLPSDPSDLTDLVARVDAARAAAECARTGGVEAFDPH